MCQENVSANICFPVMRSCISVVSLIGGLYIYPSIVSEPNLSSPATQMSQPHNLDRQSYYQWCS